MFVKLIIRLYVNKINMAKKLLYTVCLLMVMMVGCKTKNEKAAEEIWDGGGFNNKAKVKNLNASTNNYSVYLPKGWTTKHRNYRGVNIFYLLAPQTAQDPNTSINILTEYMQHYSLQVYLSKTIAAVKKAVPSAVITGQGNITANGINGSWYSYTMQPQGIQASVVSYIFPKNGVAYAITGGTLPKYAARYRSTFDSVARSLKFNE
jgi:hypothetical protein